MSSADGERGAPPMVAGHTLMDSALCLGSMPHNWSGLSVGVCYVPLRAIIGVIYNAPKHRRSAQ